MDSLELAKTAARTAMEKKATRPSIIDLRGQSDICDFQVICAADNPKQGQAIIAAIEETCFRELACKPTAIEGRSAGNWILADYGSVLVHVFLAKYRDYYAIDQIWPSAGTIALDQPPPIAAGTIASITEISEAEETDNEEDLLPGERETDSTSH